MARYEISNEVRPLDRLITGFASSCGYEIQTVFNDLLRFIIHGFSPGAPPISNWKYKRQQNASFMEMICHDSLQPKAFTDGWKVNQALPLAGIPSIRRMKEDEYRNPLPENIGRFKEAVRIINLLDK